MSTRNPTIKQQAAEYARNFLEKCETRDDVAKARLLVDHAKTLPKGHPLSQMFTWDVKEAALNWWLQEARHLVAYIKITPADGGKPIRAFVKLSQDGCGYRSTERVLEQKTMRDIYVADALNEFKRLRQKYDHLHELMPIFLAIDTAIEEMMFVEDGEEEAA